MTVLAIVVGIGAGLGAVAFRWLIAVTQRLFFGGSERFLDFLGPYRVVPVPALGGLFVGLLTYYLASEAKGHGVPEVMLAVTTLGGRIRARVAAVKSLASAICIGSGGSAGREGPIVQIGSALGSTLGQILRLPDDRIRLLVACGAAGGISATFNAPIAGVLFALEVILRQFAASSFGFVVFASVTAAAISRATLGDRPSFIVPAYSLKSAWELPLYAGLGILAAGVSVLFVKSLYGLEDFFDRWHFKEYMKPVAGGLLVGGIGVLFPQVFGTGYGSSQPVGSGLGAVDLVLVAKLGLGLTAALILLKIVATSLTIGSGGSGGVFAPSLFIGAMLGGTFGQIAHHFWPDVTAASGAYALVGMGAVFAGAARAPITSILILFEMTGDYRIILPLMTAVVTSSLISQRLSRDTIYTLKIRRRGIDLERESATDLLDTVTVGEIMTTHLETVPADMPVEQLMKYLLETGHHGLPVVDEGGELVGIVTLSDVERSAGSGDTVRTVADIASLSPFTCFPDQTVREALQQLSGREVGRMPVVDRLNPRRLLGMLRRENVIAAYARLLKQYGSVREASERLRLSVPGLITVRVEIPEEASVIGRPLQEFSMPPASLLVAIRRRGRAMIPKGDTVLMAGDIVTALASPSEADTLHDLLTQAKSVRELSEDGDIDEDTA
ncbi:MAG: CBS domain-containing protein [Armatimonadetes bacterium]|nr:CBS domain-containing protein [Armatimonadota bacterium]NIM67468.1 CBS domain-containing protein [Armatimonadota bacterium]NIM75965.1 CBS domain-containing protein [Armatimonadota bacterium]NIN05654.1 CBS domain-containing protein [Armatimonadota bacterium]NIO75647.1 CBS domain-containing protein [Armatimonadota bacterium]